MNLIGTVTKMHFMLMEIFISEWTLSLTETKWKSGQTWKSGRIGARSDFYQKKEKNLGNI